MRYADARCTYEEKFDNGQQVYVFSGPCVVSGKPQSVTVKAEELNAYRRGASIQQALRSNTANEREFLISGMSPEEFDAFFAEDHDYE